jgi:AraC-like DNA-binding protein/quercetin dioxygenase-like cupin family protein
MRPQLLKVNKGANCSISVRQDFVPHNNNWWHYHTEVELIHFEKGQGTHFIGDYVKRFNRGDIVLIGSSLPHYTRFDDEYFQDTENFVPDIRVVHFSDNLGAEELLLLPEMKGVRSVLEKSRRGLKLTGSHANKAAALMEKMLTAQGLDRLLLLFQVLNVFANARDVTMLSSIGFKPNLAEHENSRINDVYEYTLKNFRNRIELEEIARVANLSTNSFCRYFKSRTKKTYTRFLLELRVGHACKLLIEDNLNIKQVCYNCGFNNLTSFHKYFRQITGKSPRAYKNEFSEP